jgi:Rieske Fe-S protein
MNTDNREITRRSFCNRALLTSAAIALATRNVTGSSVNPRDSQVAYPPMKIVGAERVLPGASLYFSYPSMKDPAVMVRSPEGEYLAYSRKCAHLGCSVDFDSARRCLRCPCHQGTYDARTGHVIYGPPPRPLDEIVLQMSAGGEVWAVGTRIGNVNPNV